MYKARLLNEISNELLDAGKLGSSLLVITGMDAIREEKLDLWVREMHHNITVGSSTLFESIFSPRMFQLVQQYIELH